MWHMLLGLFGRLPPRILVILGVTCLLLVGIWSFNQWLTHWREEFAQAEESARVANDIAQRQELVARAWQAHAERLARLGATREQQLERNQRELAAKRQQIEELLANDQASKEWADATLPDGVHQWLRQLAANGDSGRSIAAAHAQLSDTTPAGTRGDAARTDQSRSDRAAGRLRAVAPAHEH